VAFDPAGAVEVKLQCRVTPLNQVFAYDDGGNPPVPAAFRIPGRNAIYAQLLNTTSLQLLDVSTMTYGTAIPLSSSWGKFYF